MRLFGKRKISLHAAPPLLQTPRLVLRGFDPSDAVDVLARAQGEAGGVAQACGIGRQQGGGYLSHSGSSRLLAPSLAAGDSAPSGPG